MANRHLVIDCGLFLIGIYFSLLTDVKANCSSLFKCYNNGTVFTRDNLCECACPVQFTGIVCETEILPSKWPHGPYALLMPTSGCPESTSHGWGAGVIHFTTEHELDIRKQQSLELAGNFKPYSFEFKFCFKHPNTSLNNATLLQGLNITVFGDREGCPHGLVEEVNYLPLPRLKSWWTVGYLPYFEIRNDNIDEDDLDVEEEVTSEDGDGEVDDDNDDGEVYDEDNDLDNLEEDEGEEVSNLKLLQRQSDVLADEECNEGAEEEEKLENTEEDTSFNQIEDDIARGTKRKHNDEVEE